MSTLQDFLNAHPVDNLTAEVVISERFKDAEGNRLKFKIKAMTNDEFDQIRKKATVLHTKGKRRVELDVKKLNDEIVIQNTLEPDFKDAESIKKLGCLSPDQYLNKVLLPGEIVELATQIQQLSGFDQEFEELVEDVKN
jgi:hypothetical protein